MKENSFVKMFSKIFENIWCLVQKSQVLIEQLAEYQESAMIKKKLSIMPTKEEIDEQLVQLGFEIF